MPGARLLVLAGFLAVLGGGFVAAAISQAPTRHGTWAVAYLVLAVGVAQILLGLGQAAVGAPRLGCVAAELGGWQAGSACVLAGVLERTTAIVDAGSIVLLATLMLFAVSTVRVRPGVAQSWQWGYRALLVLLALSVVSGVFLARSMPG